MACLLTSSTGMQQSNGGTENRSEHFILTLFSRKKNHLGSDFVKLSAEKLHVFYQIIIRPRIAGHLKKLCKKDPAFPFKSCSKECTFEVNTV